MGKHSVEAPRCLLLVASCPSCQLQLSMVPSVGGEFLSNVSGKLKQGKLNHLLDEAWRMRESFELCQHGRQRSAESGLQAREALDDRGE